MDRPLVQTITGDLDGRYPENEIVLGINVDGFLKAYPLKEVQRGNGVVHERMAAFPIVVFSGPLPAQVSMAAYVATADGQELVFERRGTRYVDRQTASTWTIEGLAVEGPLRGTRLSAIRSQYVRWHAWFYPHRGTELYRHHEPLPAYPALREGLEVGPFEAIVPEVNLAGGWIGLTPPPGLLEL